MDILIFSDSHGAADRMQEVLYRQIRRPDAIFFLGDGLRDLDTLRIDGIPLYAVCGNCDWFSPSPTELQVSLAGHTFFATHGHMYHTKSGYGALLCHAACQNVDIILTGHTHEAYYERLEAGTVLGGITLSRPLHLFNPGSIGGYRASFGLLTVQNGQLLFSHGTL